MLWYFIDAAIKAELKILRQACRKERSAVVRILEWCKKHEILVQIVVSVITALVVSWLYLKR